MKKAVFAIFLTMTTYPETALSQISHRSEKVIPGCRLLLSGSDLSEFQQGYCYGSVQAALLLSSSNNRSCVPGDSTMEDIINTVISFIEVEGYGKMTVFPSAAYLAIVKKWPCPK